MSDVQIRRNAINIVQVEENANLRNVNWNQAFLDKVKDKNKLTHGNAILYVNLAQDRFRLVVCFHGMAMLLLPPVTDADRRLSLYLQVSQYLKKFQGCERLQEFLESQINSTESRIDRRKRLAQRALKNIRKRNGDRTRNSNGARKKKVSKPEKPKMLPEQKPAAVYDW